MVGGYILGWASCVAFIAAYEVISLLTENMAARAKLVGGDRAQSAGDQTLTSHNTHDGSVIDG